MRFFILIILSLLLEATTFSQSSKKYDPQFGENPGNLKMSYYSPAMESDTLAKRPLVVALHGCSQSNQSISTTTGWNSLADKHNFVMLYPTQKRINNSSKCFNWFKLKDISKDSGELESIKNMIDFMIRSNYIDTSRIYIYGLSAGAAMSVALMAVYPTYFKAGAIFAGVPYKVATNNKQLLKAMLNPVHKTPKEWGELITFDRNITYPKLIVCHGTEDKVVNINHSLNLIKQWTYLHHMDTIPDQIKMNYMSPNVIRTSYNRLDTNEVIVFYKFLNTGHTIPTYPGNEPLQGGEKSKFTNNIGFFSTYHMAKEFNLIEK